MIESRSLQHFYIPEEQSIYLLSRRDAKRLKRWFNLCERQLNALGYSDVEMIGQGAYGFVFKGKSINGRSQVFKFSRIDLPPNVQDSLEDEAEMLAFVKHPNVPAFREYQRAKGQRILAMDYARGENLETISLKTGRLPVADVLTIGAQLHSIFMALRNFELENVRRPIVHGDVKPSNVMWDEDKRQIAMIDWGSSVFAQLDERGEPVVANVMQLMSDGLQTSNARLGDVYFIGNEQLNGSLSSPRFDEQGIASTLYALASGQSCRFARHIIRPCTLGLPKEFARTLEAMLSDDPQEQRRGGDYFMRHMPRMGNMICREQSPPAKSRLPVVINPDAVVDTVVYSSRKSFLRGNTADVLPTTINDAQFERYYKHYLQGMGDTEKAFIAAVSRLGKYPIMGGLAFRWANGTVDVDSELSLFDKTLETAFASAVNNVITLAQAINSEGVFKSCMFDARRTIHLSRSDSEEAFVVPDDVHLSYEVSRIPDGEVIGKTHSYFEDGDDPDEQLQLPKGIVDTVSKLNQIQHSGCIVYKCLKPT